jgi:hypothetical protein
MMDQQPPLPEGLDASGSMLHYVQYMTSRQQQQQQQQHQQHEEGGVCAEDTEAIAAYIKGGVGAWAGEEQGAHAFDSAFERTLQL